MENATSTTQETDPAENARTPALQIAAHAQPPFTSVPKKPGLEEGIKRIGTLRDGVLTSVGVVYIFGYGVWAYNAWRNNLGLLPALQFQYFVAGFLALAAIAASALVIYAGIFVEVLSTFYTICVYTILTLSKVKNEALRAHLLWTVSLVPSLALGLVAVYLTIFSHTQSYTSLGYFSSLICFYLSIYSLRGNIHGDRMSGPLQQHNASTNTHTAQLPSKINWNHNGFRLINPQLWMIVGFIATALFVIGYQSIPQEFGGAKPRFAYLDVKRADISSETRADLLPVKSQMLPADTGKDASAVVRSIMVDVYYTSSDLYLVRPHGAKVETAVIQVKKETVQGVTWLGYAESETPKPPKKTGTFKAMPVAGQPNPVQ